MASAEREETEQQENPVVRFNVGGTRFTTTVDTIQGASSSNSESENMLARLLRHDRAGTIPAARDEKGCIFIDRNGALFATVLDVLRTGRLCVPPGVTEEQILTELEFFQVTAPVPPRHAKSERHRMLEFAKAVSHGALHEPDIEAIAANLFGIVTKCVFDSRGSTVIIAKRVCTVLGSLS
jgi:BTB/POZ domain